MFYSISSIVLLFLISNNISHSYRFLLPYERHVKGEEYKPLPVSERRRLKSKINRNSISDAETSEGTSSSDNSTSMSQSMFPTSTQSAFTTAYGTTESKV